MILLDYSQICISNLMVNIKRIPKDSAVDEDMLRHMILNSIRGHRSKFHAEYGEMVICCDDRNTWRRDVFSHYKANRKKVREESTIDWTSIFEMLAKIKTEIREYLPYKVIQAERAEADDVIATLCHTYGDIVKNGNEKILILSGDKDFVQLQKYANVYQFSPVLKKFITTDNPERFLREHIMLGDQGDGVPNFLSDDDTFVTDKRQRPVSRKKLNDWVVMQPTAFCDDNMLRGYKRNEIMVNLDLIPKEIQEKIKHTYDTQIPQSRAGILQYFMDKSLRNLTSSIGDF